MHLKRISVTSQWKIQLYSLQSYYYISTHKTTMGFGYFWTMLEKNSKQIYGKTQPESCKHDLSLNFQKLSSSMLWCKFTEQILLVNKICQWHTLWYKTSQTCSQTKVFANTLIFFSSFFLIYLLIYLFICNLSYLFIYLNEIYNQNYVWSFMIYRITDRGEVNMPEFLLHAILNSEHVTNLWILYLWMTDFYTYYLCAYLVYILPVKLIKIAYAFC